MAHYCTSYPCPFCHPHAFPAQPQFFGPTPVYAPVQQGCICPPTSEQTCMSEVCPRKSRNAAAGSALEKNAKDASA